MKKALPFLVLPLLFALMLSLFSQTQAEDPPPPEEPWSNKLLNDAGAANTPQDAVGLVLNAFDGVSYQEEISQTQNLSITQALNVAYGEVWLVATDFITPTDDSEITSVNVDWGYGVWLITGPWNGTLPQAGVAVELVKTTYRLYVPKVSVPHKAAGNQLFIDTKNAVTPQDAASLVIDAANGVKYGEEISETQNFGISPTLRIADNEFWLIASDLGAPPTDEAFTPINTDWGYGVWQIAGPWEGTIPNGVGVRLVIKN